MSAPAKPLAFTPAGGTERIDRLLVREHRMKLIVNGSRYAEFCCTRGELRELAAGRLLGDGRLHDPDELLSLSLDGEERVCRAALAPRPRPAGPLAPAVWEPAWIFAAVARFTEGTPLYRATSSVHLAYLYREDRLIHTSEDLSRRCAMEKLLGYGLLNGVPMRACWIYISCRINSDLVRKAAEAGIALLASKSSPTADAAELASSLGLTLICRAWPDRFEQYC